MARPTYDPDSLLVGIIGRPHGLDGEMTLRAYNPRGADLSTVPALIFEQGTARETRRLRTVRRRADGWLVRVEGVDSRDAAAAMTHVPVRVAKQALPPLGAGEFFVEDLLGCQVRTVEADDLGVVDSIFWNGAHDVMSVREQSAPGKQAGGEHLIPLVPEFLHLVDAPHRQIVVAWQRDDEQP
ncbi:MAG: 16S rRNA processing protein RimM [Deltaproteobacteria bacterium]|nr:16S rRNA processing protein RimM [Deltaproteobacteria bacterium]